MNETKLEGRFIRLTKEQYHKLQNQSDKNNVSIASLIRLAVTDYLAKGESL